MLFNATHGADTQSRSARQEVLVYGRLNFKYRIRSREPVMISIAIESIGITYTVKT